MRLEQHLGIQPSIQDDMEMARRLERLSRQTCLAALETVMDAAAETRNLRAPCARLGLMTKAVSTHIIRASMEMQQAIRG